MPKLLSRAVRYDSTIGPTYGPTEFNYGKGLCGDIFTFLRNIIIVFVLFAIIDVVTLVVKFIFILHL